MRRDGAHHSVPALLGAGPLAGEPAGRDLAVGIGRGDPRFDFLGFHIQWRRKRGTDKRYVYTFIADRPVRSVKAKIRTLTHRTSQQDLAVVLINLNRVTHGWANYFRHAVAKRTFSKKPYLNR
ncbi:group II intron maturase-specific domain-containing protein [Streptomyces sp. NPDC102441]|uniref:group II intron maturase-specific domain-containing protein n=1 Tax=Streptomyces sp. NPDC102441 TaxID=3366176 RepID=UPI003826608B